MELKNVLRRIHPNSANLFHGRSPLFEINTRPHSGTVDAAGGRPHQQNLPFSGYTAARKPPARKGRISARRLSGGETTKLPGSGAPGLGRPVRNGAAAPDVVAKGRGLAVRLYARCHAIAPNRPNGWTDAPSFASIANRPGMTRTWLVDFIPKPHMHMSPGPTPLHR
jgi:hypothetical protein